MKFIKMIILLKLVIPELSMVNAKAGIQMETKLPEFTISRPGMTAVRLGYVRLLDAAPLIVASSLGMFRQAGLNVELSREAGWATIRDKMAFGDLDVTQALSPLPFAMQLGIGVAPSKVITGMVINCNGNAITLSQQLRDEGVVDGDSLRRYIRSGYRSRKLVLGVVSLYSSHHFTLCRWLEQHQIDPQQDVIIAVLPPEQVLRCHYDVSVLTEPLLRACARLTADAELQRIVADEAARNAYLQGRGLIDPLVDFGVKFPTAAYLVAALKSIKPRLYSISSSPKAHPGAVHLTVGKVSYETHGRQRAGVCSTYLAEHRLDRPVQVYLHANKAFRLTEGDQAPVMMIGPGTGIAPFRAFLEEREARGAAGKNCCYSAISIRLPTFCINSRSLLGSRVVC
jgi:hypothetical protein